MSTDDKKTAIIWLNVSDDKNLQLKSTQKGHVTQMQF